MPPAERDEDFAETAQAAELFGVSQRTIQLWISRGYIRAVPIGRKQRVWLESVREYLARRL
jgi:excisionase family DNA binding protein